MGVSGILWDLPFGKCLHNYGKLHHAMNGKTHDISLAIFNSELLNDKRVNSYRGHVKEWDMD